MLVIFFSWHGVVHSGFVPERQTVNSEFCREVKDRLLERLRRVRLEKAESGKWFLMHDNASPHNATTVKQFLAKKSVTVLYYPSYSPDLAPADCFLFSDVKSNLKGRRFDTISDIQNKVTNELRSSEAAEFYGGIQKF
jgi:transposase